MALAEDDSVLAKISLLALLMGCTSVHAPRLIVRGWITLDRGGHRGALGAAMGWAASPRAVLEPADLPAPWVEQVPGRVECMDVHLCAWERRARLRALEAMR